MGPRTRFSSGGAVVVSLVAVMIGASVSSVRVAASLGPGTSPGEPLRIGNA